MTTHSQYPNPTKTAHPIADAVSETKSLGICARLLGVAGLDNLLRGEGEFTLFAPTDEAFLDLPPGTLEALEQSPGELRDMLSYHILETGRALNELANGKLRTLQGTLLTSSVTDDGVRVDHANTCGHSQRCANGLIHPIDHVLMPGFTPQLSEKARALSAWSGRRPMARNAKTPTNDAWPFVEPPKAEGSSGSA